MGASQKGPTRFSEELNARLLDMGWGAPDLARAMGLLTTDDPKKGRETVRGWLNGSRTPAHEVVFQIERKMELEPGALSRWLGYLPVDAVPASSVPAAIRADESLSVSSRRSLVGIYNELRAKGL